VTARGLARSDVKANGLTRGVGKVRGRTRPVGFGAAFVHYCAFVILLVGPQQGLAQGAFADHRYTSEAIEAGSRVYVSDCALCHGTNGDVVDGVDLRRGVFRTVESDEDLRRVITTGAADGQMPAFTLSAVELDGVIAYLRAGFDPEGIAVKVGDPARGRVLFQADGCASCHRVHGLGPRTAPDLSEIGLVRTPAVLQRTLLDPSAALLPINRPVRAVTRAGETIRGRRLNEDTYTVQLIDSEERLRSLVKADLVEYEVSSTPIMQPTTLSSDQVADLVGYLLSLRGLP
jgi:putative heme-binding domain-containing protein